MNDGRGGGEKKDCKLKRILIRVPTLIGNMCQMKKCCPNSKGLQNCRATLVTLVITLANRNQRKEIQVD